MAQNNVHHGRNLRKFREWRDMKQETLALELGDDWTQKKISSLERKEEIEPALLQQISQILKVPVELFDTVNDDPAINIVNSTMTDSSVSGSGSKTNNNSFINNPIEKWLEALEDIKKLRDEKETLYERMLADKDALIEKLSGMINHRKE